MKFHFLMAVLCGLGLHSAQAIAETAPRQQWSIADADQAVLVITPDWQSPNGMLQAFERKKGAWQPVGDSKAVSIGKNGSAWGLGIHPQQPPGPVKIEGDGKAPADAVIGETVATGYTFQGRLIRPALVRLRQSPAEVAAGAAEAEPDKQSRLPLETETP